MTTDEIRALAQTVRAQGYLLSPQIHKALTELADEIERLRPYEEELRAAGVGDLERKINGTTE